MRNIGLLAFGVTTCVLVPAAISRLTAGPQQLGKLVAPGAQTLQLGGATIDVSLDRALVDPGDSIHLKLVASEAHSKHVAVGVLVYGSSGTEGDRVPAPPVGVAHETVTLDIDAQGHATKDVKLKLTGAGSRNDPFAHYTVLVMPPKAADKLDRLRSRFRLVGGNTEDDPIPGYNKSAQKFSSLYWAIKSGDAPEEAPQLFAPGAIARLEAHTRVKSSAIAIATPETTRVGQAFTVAVTVKNPSKEKLSKVEVTLATPAGLLEEGYRGLRDEAVEIEPASITVDLGRRESKRVEFKVTPRVVGTLGLYAHAAVADNWIRELESGTVDATEVVETPPIVGSR
jgi:hypothetical protein